jgi:Tol biopolymer transport system component/C-terminal processing protease CtpA/Prc
MDKTPRILWAAAAALLWSATALGATGALPSLAEPALSPDGAEIAFVSGGDIWSVAAKGGEARLLVSHPATESRPLYSPDGQRLAFVSTRTGRGDIYVLTLATGDLRRLTFDDTLDQLDAWSRDGRWIYFSASSGDVSGVNDIWRVSAAGGTPMPVEAERYVNEFFAAPSPDGAALAFAARGIASSQWWRHGHSHIDESEIWIERAGTPRTYERVTEKGGAKELWPMWAPDARTLYYVSDRGGAENIWMRAPGAPARQLTSFRDGRVLWPGISLDGRTIVFERDFRIWKLNTRNREASAVPIALRGAPAGPAVEHVKVTDGFHELALSPDGKKVAFTARGDVFAASSKDGGDAERVTRTPEDESGIAWAPDSKRIVYVSDREGAGRLYLYDFATRKETELTHGAEGDDSPAFSPDGKLIAFERGGREVRVVDPQGGTERLLATARFEKAPLKSGRPLAWSPDNRWVAFFARGGKLFQSVWVVPATGGEARQVSFLANSEGNTVSWGPDGTYLLFDTSQRTEDGQLARVDLVPRAPRFHEDQFHELFREAAAPDAAAAASAKRPPVKDVSIEFDGVRRRLELIPAGLDVASQVIAADGKSVLLIASAAGQQNLYTYSLDELAKEPAVARQLTSTPGRKADAQFSPDGKEVFFLDAGRISAVTVESRQVRTVAVAAELDIDFAREKMEVFRQAWRYERDNFFDPKLHGVDWERVRAQYEPLVAGAHTRDEVHRLISLMVGELNASHLGISANGSPQHSTGRLGLRFDRAEYEASGRLRVSEVIPLSPAALAGQIHTGDTLEAVDATPVTARTNLDELLAFRIGKRVVLSVADAAGKKRDVVVRPVNSAAERNLLYRKWVEDNRAYVARISNGRLGYVHMRDMGSGSLAQLFVDLDTENQSREGVVIDIRNNNGGFVNAYALDVLARRPYLTMTVRGFPAAPARSVLGQRALEAPTVLVTNRQSLSDAEDFAEGYRALKLGKVVGEPTAGWIIYTSGVPLVDGSTLRIPHIAITAHDGAPMEMNPRPVDVEVVRPIGESLTGKDSDLDTAVRELLGQLR